MPILLLHGNWVDFLIIIFVLLMVWEAYRRGFIVGLFDFLGFAVSFAVALSYYTIVSDLLIANFSFSKGIADVIGFFALSFTAEIVFSYIFSYIVALLPDTITNNRLNTVLGILPPIATALVTTTFVLTLLLSLPLRGEIKSVIVQSRIGGALVAQTQQLEHKLSAVFGTAAFETLNFLTITPDIDSSESIDLHFTQEMHTVDEAAEKELFMLVNTERTVRGLPPLTLDANLVTVAREHAMDMFERGYFSHYTIEGTSPFDRMRTNDVVFQIAGENLAYAPIVQIAHQGLMESERHRDNILSSVFTRVGIGVIDGGVYGKMFVQEFAD